MALCQDLEFFSNLLAEASGDEYALPAQFPVVWDVGAPLPHLLMSEQKVFLIFCAQQTEYPQGDVWPVAMVEFDRVMSVKMGAPNDEVFKGHSLHGKGMKAYTAQIVKNSRWVMELQRINSVHSLYRPDFWTELNHYVFWFHDTTFECVAKSFRVEIHRCSLSELIKKAAEMM